MTVLLAALGGATFMLAFLLAGCMYAAKRLRRSPSARSIASSFLRAYALTSGMESLVLYYKGEPVIVGFEELARAIDKGEIISHDARPPPPPGETVDDSCDGNA